MAKPKRSITHFWQNASFAMLLIALACGGYFLASVWQQLKDLPDISALEKYEPIEAIQIFDRYDHLVATVEGDEDRQIVPLSQVCTQMQQAILAAEDHHFYEHHGINVISIMRAFLTNLQAGHIVEGGSTITQQLVKNLFFEEKGRTIERKIKEAFIAAEIERRHTKDKILEMYLNQVYFGSGGYGVERAASRYFDKSSATLSLAEAAFLAGLVKAPSEMGNTANREIAISRQKEIINKMVEYGYITVEQAKAARKQKLVFKKGVNPLAKYPYYISYVLQQLRNRFSQSEMRKQGLRVFTHLDPAVQELAEKTLEEDIKKTPKGVSQSALVSVLVKDGSVVALVGGVGNFWKNQWNRATNPHTAGSAFKPFVYLAAFLQGKFRPDSLIDDAPLTIKQGWGLPDWSPKNFDHKFMGRITVRKALTLSRNVPAVRVAKAIGIENVIETARLAGISAKLDPNLSLALGSSAVSPLEMAGAFATFARSGVAIKPQILRRIENSRGQIIEVFEPLVNKVFESNKVAQLVEILQDVVRCGTGTQARLPDRPVAGKTGTADAAKDIWFIGFTPDLVTAVWGGNDENLPIPGQNVTGGVVMAKIWQHFTKAYYSMHPTPPGIFMVPNKSLELNNETPEPSLQEQSPRIPTLVPLLPKADLGEDEQDSSSGNSLDSQATIIPATEDTPNTTTSSPASDPAPAPALIPTPPASTTQPQPSSTDLNQTTSSERALHETIRENIGNQPRFQHREPSLIPSTNRRFIHGDAHLVH